VDFVLLRSVTRSIKGQDSRNKLYTLIHGNVPSINSLMSAYVCLERVTVFAALKQIENKLGHDNFPLIAQNMYPNHRTMIITPEFPLVVKVGAVHAGYGKMKCDTARQFADFKSVSALHGDYVTAEPFIDWDYDMRIQKIGHHYRAFRRVSTNWKGNVGNESIIEDMEMTERYTLMVDECAKLFGGLDILALDLVHAKSGKEWILELNDTAIGLVHKYANEDMYYMRDLVVTKMSQLFSQQTNNNISQEPIDIELLRNKLLVMEIEIKREKEKSALLIERLKQVQQTDDEEEKNCIQQ